MTDDFLFSLRQDQVVSTSITWNDLLFVAIKFGLAAGEIAIGVYNAGKGALLCYLHEACKAGFSEALSRLVRHAIAWCMYLAIEMMKMEDVQDSAEKSIAALPSILRYGRVHTLHSGHILK